MNDWTFWRGQPPPKGKKRRHNRIRAIDVGALTTLGTVAHMDQ
jgi:hypothetical protein